jgi:hypothetical protein
MDLGGPLAPCLHVRRPIPWSAQSVRQRSLIAWFPRPCWAQLRSWLLPAISTWRVRSVPVHAIYEWPETAADGGLLGYGAPIAWLYRRVAVFVDKILRGARPADLPIEQPTKFELVVNLRTANAIGLNLSPSLLLRADRVIE